MSIILYTQPDCRSCKRVAQKLDDAGIDFELVDLSHNLIAHDYVKKVLGASSVPILEVDGQEPIFGYDPDKLKDLIHDYVWTPEEDEE